MRQLASLSHARQNVRAAEDGVLALRDISIQVELLEKNFEGMQESFASKLASMEVMQKKILLELKRARGGGSTDLLEENCERVEG